MITERLAQVGKIDYDHRGSLTQPVFQTLDALKEELKAFVPSHFIVTRSKGAGVPPLGLWVSILDPDVTDSPTRGTYVVFLFNRERTHVSLSLNQGVTAATDRARELGMRPKDLLRSDAAIVRDLLGAETNDLEPDIELGPGDLLRKYEAGNIYAKTWSLDELPTDKTIVQFVRRFLGLYTDAVVAKEVAMLRGAAQIPPRDPGVAPKPRKLQREFKPKDDSDYRANIEAAVQIRSRSHETLVKRFGEWARGRGFEPNTGLHPRDLVLHQDQGPDYLVEVKVFPPGRPLRGTRECIGQLFEYRHFYATPDVPLIAAFSENPGDAYIGLNQAIGIATMWPDGYGTWHGCAMARDLNLID
jgi:hypothetical protein